MAEIKGRLSALERSLHINVLREFELLGEEAPSPLLLERLKSCCLVVEALGYQVGGVGQGYTVAGVGLGQCGRRRVVGAGSACLWVCWEAIGWADWGRWTGVHAIHLCCPEIFEKPLTQHLSALPPPCRCGTS